MKIELTTKETLIIYGFLQSVLNKVEETPELELIDRKNTTTELTNIMSKLAGELDKQINNN